MFILCLINVSWLILLSSSMFSFMICFFLMCVMLFTFSPSVFWNDSIKSNQSIVQPSDSSCFSQQLDDWLVDHGRCCYSGTWLICFIKTYCMIVSKPNQNKPLLFLWTFSTRLKHELSELINFSLLSSLLSQHCAVRSQHIILLNCSNCINQYEHVKIKTSGWNQWKQIRGRKMLTGDRILSPQPVIASKY